MFAYNEDALLILLTFMLKSVLVSLLPLRLFCLRLKKKKNTFRSKKKKKGNESYKKKKKVDGLGLVFPCSNSHCAENGNKPVMMVNVVNVRPGLSDFDTWVEAQ